MNRFNIKKLIQNKLEENDTSYSQLTDDQVLVLPMDYTSILKHHKGEITNLEFMWYNNLELIDGEYVVKDYFIPKQEVTGATCAEDATDWKCQLYKTNCYIWAHSHVNMGVSPSAQDEKETEEQLDLCFSALEEGEHTYFVRLIMNKSFDISLAGYLIYNYKGIKITEEVDFELELSDGSIEDVTDVEGKINKKVVRTVNSVGYNKHNSIHSLHSIAAQNKANHATPSRKANRASKHIDDHDINKEIKEELAKYDGRLTLEDWDELDNWTNPQ